MAEAISMRSPTAPSSIKSGDRMPRVDSATRGASRSDAPGLSRPITFRKLLRRSLSSSAENRRGTQTSGRKSREAKGMVVRGWSTPTTVRLMPSS